MTEAELVVHVVSLQSSGYFWILFSTTGTRRCTANQTMGIQFSPASVDATNTNGAAMNPHSWMQSVREYGQKLQVLTY
jgi:hypothetical protein